MFAAIYESGPQAFQHMIVGGDGEEGLRRFWGHEQDKAWVREHPGFKQFGHNPSTCVPIGVHADKGQHISRDKILNIAWGSTIARSPTVYSKFMFTVVPDELIIKGKTDEELYAVLVWSLSFLIRGLA